MTLCISYCIYCVLCNPLVLKVLWSVAVAAVVVTSSVLWHWYLTFTVSSVVFVVQFSDL